VESAALAPARPIQLHEEVLMNRICRICRCLAGVAGSGAAVASPAAVLRPRPGSPRRIGRHCVTVTVGLAMLALAACGTTASPAGGGPAAPPPGQPASSPAGLRLVAIGDSIPYNSPDDCHGCTGLVDQYAKAVQKATGKQVTVQNLSSTPA
jgi:hypothetical protein